MYKAQKFFVSKHKIFSATSFDLKNRVPNHQNRGKETRLNVYIWIWYLISEMQGRI